MAGDLGGGLCLFKKVLYNLGLRQSAAQQSERARRGGGERDGYREGGIGTQSWEGWPERERTSESRSGLRVYMCGHTHAHTHTHTRNNALYNRAFSMDTHIVERRRETRREERAGRICMPASTLHAPRLSTTIISM